VPNQLGTQDLTDSFIAAGYPAAIEPIDINSTDNLTMSN